MSDPFDIPVGSRPLHFFWIVDTSGSMSYDGKIQELNTAVKEALPNMRSAAASNPEAEVLVRVLSFESSASWVTQPTKVEDFVWENLTTGGLTAMGEALTKVADQLKMPPMSSRGLPPVLALVSDGQPTDEFTAGLARLNGEPWAKRAVRCAIAIGRDADHDVLRAFTGPEYPVFHAGNSDQLAAFIRWMSTEPIKAASGGSVRSPDQPGASVPNQIALPPADDPGGNIVW